VKLNLPLNPILAALLCFAFLTLAPKANAEADGLEDIDAIDGIVAQVREKLPDSAYQIMSYDDLVRLSPEKRMEYIDDLRELVAELELSESGGPVQTQRSKELNAYLLFLNSFIETAVAAQRWTPASIYPIKTRVPALVSRDGKEKRGVWCPSPLIVGNVMNHNYVCRIKGYVRSCPAGFTAIHQQSSGTFACVTNGSFIRLRPDDQKIMRNVNPAAAKSPTTQVFVRSGPQPPNVRILAAAKPAPKSNKPLAKPANRSVAAQEKPVKPRKSRKSPKPAPASEAESPEAASDAEFQADETPATPATPSKDAEAQPTKFEVVPIAEWSRPPSMSDVDAREKEINDCLGNRPEPACTESAKEDARKALLQSNNNVCFYAGNLSTWKKGSNSNTCNPPFEFCFGKASCRDDKNDLLQPKPDLSCKSSEIICNPYIFSVKSDGQPWCVKPGPDATQECDSKSRIYVGDGSKSIPLVDRESKHFLFSYIARRAKGQEESEESKAMRHKMMGGWDEFRKKMNEMCFDNQNLKTFYCSECLTIKRRVLWMNVKALTPTKDAPACSGFRALRRGDPTNKLGPSQPAAPVPTQRQDGAS
jgi:hypothetical protein